MIQSIMFLNRYCYRHLYYLSKFRGKASPGLPFPSRKLIMNPPCPQMRSILITETRLTILSKDLKDICCSHSECREEDENECRTWAMKGADIGCETANSTLITHLSSRQMILSLSWQRHSKHCTSQQKSHIAMSRYPWCLRHPIIV